ncbi:hypothetical protein [Streptomyces fulvoviolaceus]|uniref:hypothetical protein n=1 Tax=Streptomyces fulvoviolaceus TaxID=285535 RepID=UPI0021BE0B4E|nr:hypothetical protein [Streptomyces fulvoviolaceus]MCT9081910.1 hypothetical protein [Streptomyces fulvoviolaceus]
MRRFLTALTTSVGQSRAAPTGTQTTGTLPAPESTTPQDPAETPTTAENQSLQEPWSHHTVHDLFALGMKDRNQADTLDGLLNSEHERSLHRNDQELKGFLAKAGCLTLCISVLVGSLVVSVHIAKGLDLQEARLSPTAHVALVSVGSALLTGTVGWLLGKLRNRRAPTGRPQGRTGPAGLNDPMRNGDRPANERRSDAPQRDSGT